MATVDAQFKYICDKILKTGFDYIDERRDVKRRQLSSVVFYHSFDNGFPALTLKKLHFKSIVGELIWFLRGDNNIRYLNENGISIWNKDAYNWYMRAFYENNIPLTEEEFNKEGYGDVGRNYSRQWRDFNGYFNNIDQIQNLVEGMKQNIMDTRLIVTAWNPTELDLTPLPPCHTGFQIVGVPLERGKYGFELHWTMRSWDFFLGAPFNIASYALLAKILENITGHIALGIQCDAKNVHLYENQYDATKELITRDVTKYPNCDVRIDFDFSKYDNVSDMFNSLQIEHIKLVGYDSYPNIKVEMLAPKSI